MSSLRAGRLPRRSAAGLIAIFSYLYVEILFRIIFEHHRSDFFHFYKAALAMRAGQDPYVSGTGGYGYPPLLAVLLIPLTYLGETASAAVWHTINTPLAFASIWVAARQASSRLAPGRAKDLTAAVALLTAVLTFGRLKAELQMLQTDGLILALYIFAVALVDAHPFIAGSCLGLAINIKYYAFPAVIYLALRRRWTAAAAGTFSTIMIAALPGVVTGSRANLQYLKIALAGVLKSVGLTNAPTESARVHNVIDGVSISVTSGIARIEALRHDSNAPLLTVCVMLILLTISMLIYIRRRLPLWLWPRRSEQFTRLFRSLFILEWAGLMVAALAFSPDTNTRHLLLVALANAIAATLFLTARTSSDRWWLIGAAGLQLLGFDSPNHWPIHQAALAFAFAGGQAWCLLIFYVLILYRGTLRIAYAVDDPIKSTSQAVGWKTASPL